jgi:hypothetical protein
MFQRLRRWYQRWRLQRLCEPISAAFEQNPVEAFSWLPALETALQRVSCDKAHYRARVRCQFEAQTANFGTMVQQANRIYQAVNSRSRDLERYRGSSKTAGLVNLDQYLIDTTGLPIFEQDAVIILQRLIHEHLVLIDRWERMDPSYAEYVKQALLYLYVDWVGLGVTFAQLDLSLLQE